MKPSHPTKTKLAICLIFALSSVTYYSLGSAPETVEPKESNIESNRASPDSSNFLSQIIEKIEVTEGALFDPAYWTRSFYNLKNFQRH